MFSQGKRGEIGWDQLAEVGERTVMRGNSPVE